MAGEDSKDAEAAKISKMQEENERLKYRIKILERALEDNKNSSQESRNKK